MGRRAFVRTAATAAEGAIFPLLVGSTREKGFEREFEDRYGHPPDYAAVHTYDATRLLIAAIHEAGLSRARIRDALAEMTPWRGAGGTVEWDPLGQNLRAARAGTIVRGRLTPLSR